MHGKETRITYETTNTYSTLNELTDRTEKTWMVFHGMGFLSRYFIRYFRGLDKDKNYIIAPQAPSKYYQKDNFKYVGTSWLTKEETKEETQNVLRYIDAVYRAENVAQSKNLILYGFSQGVSVMIRWLISRAIKPTMVVIHAGVIPKELTPEDGKILADVPIRLVCGNQDPYFTPERIQTERERADRLFPKSPIKTVRFEGKHEMKRGVVEELGLKNHTAE